MSRLLLLLLLMMMMMTQYYAVTRGTRMPSKLPSKYHHRATKWNAAG